MMGNVRADAEAIWSAAIRSAQPLRLMTDGRLICDPQQAWTFAGAAIEPAVHLDAIDRIVVVGAGKAAAGMAAGVEQLLATTDRSRHRLAGVVSVPAGTDAPLQHVSLCPTRPVGENLPTLESVAVTGEILLLMASLGPSDLAIAVITGGASALLVAPRVGVTLAEKISLTQFLLAAGADIAELNTVRRATSLVKAGGLARACTAGRLVVFILSDVIGDRLDVIASGPCMPIVAQPEEALAILKKYGAIEAGVVPQLERLLLADRDTQVAQPHSFISNWTTPRGCNVSHTIVGNNQTAVASAAAVAQRRGYQTEGRTTAPVDCFSPPESAEAAGHRLAGEAAALLAAARTDGRPRALIEGGEPTVRVPLDHGRGGRNQQLVLAAIHSIQRAGMPWPEGLLIASIGTDGEDGPTDAAGAHAGSSVFAAIAQQALDVPTALARCDAYPLFAAAGGLIRTGPTGTNVADVRIILARPT